MKIRLQATGVACDARNLFTGATKALVAWNERAASESWKSGSQCPEWLSQSLEVEADLASPGGLNFGGLFGGGGTATAQVVGSLGGGWLVVSGTPVCPACAKFALETGVLVRKGQKESDDEG